MNFPTITDRQNYMIQIVKGQKHLGSFTSQAEQNLCEIRYVFQKDQWLRTTFRRFVQLWLYKRYGRRFLNTEDPATLMLPTRPIQIFDVERRGTYIFEATTLKSVHVNDLTYSDWLFPEPKEPRNPLTNLPFRQGQILEAVRALRAYNISHWAIEGYMSSKQIMKTFRDVFLVPLKLRGLYEVVKMPHHEECVEYLTEFIEDEYDYHEVENRNILILLLWASRKGIDSPYMNMWRRVMRQYHHYIIVYGREIFHNSPMMQSTIHNQTEHLFGNTREVARLRAEWLTTQPPRRILPRPLQSPIPVEPIPVEPIIEQLHIIESITSTITSAYSLLSVIQDGPNDPDEENNMIIVGSDETESESETKSAEEE
jgi:hypothetical protein